MAKKLWGKNKVKVDLASYMHYIRGVKKVGKTTLFYDIIKTMFDGDMEKGLLISLGDEDGYKTLDDLVVAQAETWRELSEIVNELVANKKDNDFEFIALDTVDELFNIGAAEVMRLSKKKTGKVCDTLNSAFGGYGAGREKLKELIRNEIAKLKGAGYGIFAIGHTKLRNVKEKGTDEEYQQLTTSLNFDYDSVISDKADIVATISIDKNIVDIKDVEVGGKSKKIGSLGGVTRWIHFRDDNFNVDCGARFEDIVPKVELSAANYINAINDAIKSSSKKSDKEIKDMKKEEVSEREQKAEEYIEGQIGINVERNEELIITIQQKFSEADSDTKAKVKETMVEHGIPNFKNSDELSTKGLEAIVAVLS